jgi:hypothetical protein
VVGSPTLIAYGTATDRCGGVTGHATDRRTIGVAERALERVMHYLTGKIDYRIHYSRYPILLEG